MLLLLTQSLLKWRPGNKKSGVWWRRIFCVKLHTGFLFPHEVYRYAALIICNHNPVNTLIEFVYRQRNRITGIAGRMPPLYTTTIGNGNRIGSFSAIYF